MNKKKWYKRIIDFIPTNTVLISTIVFILTSLFITYISRNYYGGEFVRNVLVEAHGMLFDILVIGIFILSLNRLAERRILKRAENQRYLEEIDDFRGWESEEAAYRIVGNLKRLERNRYKGKINLFSCYIAPAVFFKNKSFWNYIGPHLSNVNLKDAHISADLSRGNLSGAYLTGVNFVGIELVGTNLSGTYLLGASLSNANLSGANLSGAVLAKADLRKTKGLTIDQLSTVATLYKAKLDPELMAQVKGKYPCLLEKPNFMLEGDVQEK